MASLFLCMTPVYILYPKSIDKFYIGCTGDELNQRIRRHLSDHSGFSARTKDWILVYKEVYQNKTIALKREKEIKSWKSKKRIRQLIDSAK